MTVATTKPKMSVYLDQDLLEWFQQYCKQQKRSASSQIVYMIEELREKNQKEV
jgi:succinate dehydrogenase flavin-adding protein (antitoxin of CptAB toxin-antitoxin module)